MVLRDPSLDPDRLRPVHAMGLSFANPLGLAAGLDRTGANLSALVAAGAGHVELGTLCTGAAARELRVPPDRAVRIGANIGSTRCGIGRAVIMDYVAAMREVAAWADYIVVNLTAPDRGRTCDTPGIPTLLEQLREARDRSETTRSRPLLIKIAGGADGDPLPLAVHVARSIGLDGVVLVCASARRIEAFARHLGSGALISVGGIDSGEELDRRLAAGAVLAQIHTAYVQHGAPIISRMLCRQPARQDR